ncbi:hypothetical protein AXF42_Ash012073 [Apostasia shenzhenica]|uniref:Uncharacterized protein n=1 Tax=Apostasia shenzhenica TaxID=1088818 RepID=A0A2I0AJR9_9ASPA|nr:hypothetical protein AXF42_Ash012073 [Apostasia shenzhenica]
MPLFRPSFPSPIKQRRPWQKRGDVFLIIWERIYSELSLKRSGQVAKDFSPALWQVAAFGVFSTDRSRAGGCGFVSGTTQRSGQVVTDFIVGTAAGGCGRRSFTDRTEQVAAVSSRGQFGFV